MKRGHRVATAQPISDVVLLVPSSKKPARSIRLEERAGDWGKKRGHVRDRHELRFGHGAQEDLALPPGDGVRLAFSQFRAPTGPESCLFLWRQGARRSVSIYCRGDTALCVAT